MLKVLVASDSFKGSLSSSEIIQAVQEAGDRIGNVEVIGIPIADGGEGTLDSILDFLKGKRISCEVVDPLGRKISTYYGIAKNTAIIEMASSSGITLLSKEERNPLYTTSYGFGEMIRHALDQPEVQSIMVGIGGSATNDGGIGMAQALGLRALDRQQKEIPWGGAYLGKIETLDVQHLHPRLKEVPIHVMCDVTNTLCGENGATYVYGPQKGASPEMLPILEQNLNHLAQKINNDLGIEVLGLPGGGAAGGVGAALFAFCQAKLQSGIHMVLDLFEFDQIIQEVDLVITGEGKTDRQTAFGKAVSGVATRAKPYRKPVVCLSGALDDLPLDELYQLGINAFFSSCPRPTSEQTAIQNAYSHVVFTAENIIRLFWSQNDMDWMSVEKGVH